MWQYTEDKSCNQFFCWHSGFTVFTLHTSEMFALCGPCEKRTVPNCCPKLNRAKEESAGGRLPPSSPTLSPYFVKQSMCILVAQSCLTLWDPRDCSPPGSFVYGILQARILKCGGGYLTGFLCCSSSNIMVYWKCLFHEWVQRYTDACFNQNDDVSDHWLGTTWICHWIGNIFDAFQILFPF